VLASVEEHEHKDYRPNDSEELQDNPRRRNAGTDATTARAVDRSLRTDPEWDFGEPQAEKGSD
jgi:hypothetical protein